MRCGSLYHPDLPTDQVETLVEDFGGVPKVLISPYPDLESPIAMVAWKRKLRLEVPDFNSIARFIIVFRDATAPEPGASYCGAGTTSP